MIRFWSYDRACTCPQWSVPYGMFIRSQLGIYLRTRRMNLDSESLNLKMKLSWSVRSFPSFVHRRDSPPLPNVILHAWVFPWQLTVAPNEIQHLVFLPAHAWAILLLLLDFLIAAHFLLASTVLWSLHPLDFQLAIHKHIHSLMVIFTRFVAVTCSNEHELHCHDHDIWKHEESSEEQNPDCHQKDEDLRLVSASILSPSWASQQVSLAWISKNLNRVLCFRDVSHLHGYVVTVIV